MNPSFPEILAPGIRGFLGCSRPWKNTLKNWSRYVLTLLRSGCAKILRIGIVIEKITNKWQWWKCWDSANSKEPSFLCFWSAKKLGRPTDFWSFRELKEGIDQRDVDKWYKGYLRMNYITHGHFRKTYRRVRNIRYIGQLWGYDMVICQANSKSSGVQEMCSSPEVSIWRPVKCASTITKWACYKTFWTVMNEEGCSSASVKGFL